MIFSRRKKLLLIINPCAGRMQGTRAMGDIVRLFCDNRYDVTVYTTQARLDATEMACRTGGDYKLIVCCGGDGTLNEVISGVMLGGHNVPIGYIPCGTTNDLARSLGLPHGIMEAAKVIIDGRPTEQDVGLFGASRYFTYVASFGAFTRVSYATPQNVKNTFGHMAYLAEGLKSVGEIKPIPLRLEYNGISEADDYIFGAVTNSTSVGGVMKLKDGAVDLRDGVFELMMVKAPKKTGDLGKILNEVLTQSYTSGLVTFAHTDSVTFYSENPLDWTVDGEPGGDTVEVTVRNLHNAVKLMLPYSDK